MSADTQTTVNAAPGTQEDEAAAIVVDTLSKNYGSNPVVDQISFTVRKGEIFALLGPNGAGKTTTVEILEGYRAPDSGQVRVLGLEPMRQAAQLKAQVGVMLQQDGLYPGLNAREILHLFASYYARSHNINVLLAKLGLAGVAKTRYRRLSGGQKRRLALAVALVGYPKLVFLDEPTTGMDPQARLATWEILRELKQNGVTILMTTHLMDEAERLADRIAIIDHGRLIALDTPAGLTGTQDSHTVRFTASPGLDCTQLAQLPFALKAEETRPGSYLIDTESVPAFLAELTAWLRDQHIVLSELRVGHGSLEELFLRLTGEEVRE